LALGDRQKLHPPQNPKEKKLRPLVFAEPSDWLRQISISKTMLPFQPGLIHFLRARYS